MNRSIALRGLGTLLLGSAVAGCATVAPVPYSGMGQVAFALPDDLVAGGERDHAFELQSRVRRWSRPVRTG